MKSLMKMLSAYALIAVAMNCYGSDEENQGQKITVKIKNSFAGSDDSPKTVYGNIYETSASGKVIEKDPRYFDIRVNTCVTKDIYKPLALKERVTKYHRLIFARTPQALKDKILGNKNSNNVDSIKIAQSGLKNTAAIEECYQIGAASQKSKKNIQIERIKSCSKVSCNQTQNNPGTFPVSNL